ncbi:MAG: glycosyltransferase family 39 protein [Candidatus Aminicenantes bacterium]|nr:glycosyltransferase family 39 protein [Candidatus Aminicenantes bacterium]
MASPFEDSGLGEKPFFSPPARFILILFLVTAALAIRVYRIQNPLLGINANCQYRSALISRALYYEATPSVPQWKKDMAALEKKERGLYEPPIIDYLAFFSYRISGGIRLWIPRIFSIIFWFIGGFFLYKIAKKCFSAEGALFSLGIYLFLPFGILVSRSFQPDPLMIMGFMASIYTIILIYENPSPKRYIITLIVTALAILIKFKTVFPILGAFVFIGIFSQGFRSFVLKWKHWAFIGFSLIPSFLYYGYVAFVTKTLKTGGYFIPQLFVTKMFWKGWFNKIGMVTGFTIFLGALLGILLISRKYTQGLMLGLWSGYIGFCLVFTYTTYSHPYYHLQLVPIAALSVAPLGNILLKKLGGRLKSGILKTAVVCLLLIPAALSIREAKWKLNNKEFMKKAHIAQEIGEAVNHSRKTIYLADHYGSWLHYHGEFRGWIWPTHWDIQEKRLRGETIPSVEQHFKSIHGRFDNDFFIVTFLEEFEKQKDLQQFLFSNFPLFKKTKDYLIFDLRRE